MAIVRDIKDKIHELIYLARKTRSSTSIFLSRNILRNEGGLDLYVIGYSKLAVARLLSGKKASNDVDNTDAATISSLRKNKYAPINLDVSSDLIQSITKKVDELIENPDYSYVRGSRYGNTEEKYYTRALKDVPNNIPEVREILSPRLKGIINNYYKTDMGVTSVLLWRNYHVPNTEENKIFFSNDWHNDYIEPTELKLFINLTDVTADDGPLHVIDKAETIRLFKNKVFTSRQKKKDVTKIEKSNHLAKHIGSAGSGMFAHASYCLHRADIPKEGHYRDMLEFQFHPASKELQDNWYEEKNKYR